MIQFYKKLYTLAAAMLFAGTINAQVELLTDGGFEAGPGGAWTETSTNFGTPLCDLANCGTGTGTGPHAGTYWAWFGGIPATVETGSLTQSITIPAGGTASLTFWLEQILCDSPQDFLEVSVDGNIVFSSDGSSPLCGVLGYSLQTIDISAYADGNSHDLAFNSTTFSANGNPTNIFVDDVSVMYTTSGGPACPNILVDGTFELGPGGGSWTEFSTNFGTPLCDLANCGNGSGTGPHAGTYWAWFGGFAGGTETGTLTQSVLFPAGDSITLTFWLEQFVCDGATDFLEVTVDGNQVFLTDGASPLCGVLGYSQQSIDLTAYADGNSHIIEFNSTTFSVNANVTNFFVDDIILESCSNNPPAVVCADTATFAAVNVAIPDADPAGITSTQTVSGIPGTTLGTDVELQTVCFQIDHTWVGDLIVTLTSPSGASVVLLDRPGVPASLAGCDGDNINVCVEVGTGNEMENVCGLGVPTIAGTFTAANGTDLNAINTAGGVANGSWILSASDNVADDIGTILSWSLIFNTGPVASWTAPAAICATSTPIALTPLVTGTAGGTWSGTGVTGTTFDPTGLSGSIAVTYTVADTATGCGDSQTNNIMVDNAVPVASFTSSIISLTANFNNTSTNGTSYLWDFGDTGTSTLVNPIHTYAAVGTYTVTLTVTNACGTDISTAQITVLGCPDVIVDGSFEAGPGGGAWTEFSTNFGTPICDASCGLGGGTGPLTGLFWTWFGGIAAFEEGSMSQTVTIAANSTANLTFWLEQNICDDPSDFLRVAVDGDTLYTTDGASPLCGIIGYSLQTVNLDAYADGNTHTITFLSRIYGINGDGSNFFVDDVALNVCPFIGFTENDLNSHITVMPVPARDFVDIKFTDMALTNVKIEVTDVMGKNVLSNTIARVNDNQSERLDVSKWSRGVYMMKVSSGSNSVLRKIVVQ
jgi:PKD repeat protein